MGRPLEGAAVVVAGAGGAAHAVVYTCLAAGARSVTIGNRNRPPRRHLATRFGSIGLGSTRGVRARRGRVPRRARARPTSPSTRRPSGWSIAGDDDRRSIVHARRGDGVRPRLRPRRDAAPRGGAGARASTPRTAPRCSSPRPRSRSSAGRASAGMADVMREAVAPLLADPDGGGLSDAARDVSSRRGSSSRRRRGRRALPIGWRRLAAAAMRAIAGGRDEARARARLGGRATGRRRGSRSTSCTLGPAVPDPGAIYTVGLNYRAHGEPPGAARTGRSSTARPPRRSRATARRSPGTGRSPTNVDAECELGIVIGATASNVTPAEALRHVFGWTIINDVSSRDEWLDGDQWLIGKSMPGFCPVGPWVVTADELDPARHRPRLHDQRRGDPGRPDVGDAVRHRGDRLVPQPAPRPAAGRPHRLRHARTARRRRPAPAGGSRPATA